MPAELSPSAHGLKLAEDFRNQHDLGSTPILGTEELFNLIEADFIILDLPHNLDAITLLDPESGAKIIGIGTTQFPFRQRLSIAHEIGHVIAQDISKSAEGFVCQKSTPAETRANSFARGLLCPATALLHYFNSDNPLQSLSDIVQRFQVSPQVALIQLEAAQLISAETKQELHNVTAPQLAVSFGWKPEYNHLRRISSIPQPAARLTADAYKAFRSGKVSASTVAFAEGSSAIEVQLEATLARTLAAEDPKRANITEHLSPKEAFAELNAIFGEQE